MLLVNVNTKQFIPSPGSNFIQPVESRDQIIYGTRREVRFQLYNTGGTVFALNESDVFCCAGDINFIHTDDLMFYSGHEMCRIIDAAQGIVGVTIDATSDSFAAKATSQNTRMYVQLKRHVAGDTLGDTVLQDIVYAQPAVMTTEGAPASSDPEYMTAAATLALLRTAPDYQFSADGETDWHDQQDIASDRFYRERRNGGEWGPAIELIEGKTGPTGAAAGFGTPTIAVETLPAGSDATASVTASGDNTAKVFNFNFGIPKGADGENGTDGKAGADGVSSYTYVAYASDASGAGFSLTPTDALKYRAEIHTITAIETPDAEDFAGATWVKYLGDDGTGTGDMTKSVYDTNNDGIVDHAATADAVGATTAAQVADAVGEAHTHANKATLDKFGEANGKPTFDGAEIGGGSGTVKSVNGQFPDESGNVTVETGGAVDESRLLPDPASVSVDSNGNPVIFKAISEGLDEHTLLYLPFDSNAADQSSYKCSVSALEDGMLFIDPNHKKFGEASLGMSGDSSSSTAKKLIATLNAPLANSDFTIHGWIRVTDEYYQRALFTFQETGNNGKYESGDYSSNCFSVVFWGATRILLVHFSGNGDANLNYAGADIQNVNLNEWVHVAFTRSANTFFVFVNGKLTITKSATESLPEYIAIGNYGGSESAIHNINGNIDEFIILNYAKWTEDFDVPTQPASTLVKSYGVSDKTPVTSDSPRLLPENPANGDIPCFDASVGEWGKLNKSELALKSDVFSAWHQLSGSSAITLDRANGELQKVTLTQNCTLTAPTLDADHPTLLLQVTSSSAVTVTVGETNIVTDHTGTFQVGWYWDGEATRRYPAVEVA